MLTLCRPDKLNGWELGVRQLQLGISGRADPLRRRRPRRPGLRAEGRAFCAGIDVTAPAATSAAAPAPSAPAQLLRGPAPDARALPHLRPPPQPVVAAVQGYALGFGFELALLADIRIAADNAVFALPKPSSASPSTRAATWRIAREAGAGWAKYLALTGRRIDAAAANASTSSSSWSRSTTSTRPPGRSRRHRRQRPARRPGHQTPVDSHADAAWTPPSPRPH
ncbi:enoyl-CoA hydratase/isomerase family protein [Yinghuangia aomiensis]